jgi:hypothetical protein
MAKSKVDTKALAGSMKSGGHRPGKPYYFITVRRKRDGKVVHVPIFTPPKGAGARRAAARHNARQRAQQTGQTPAERNAKAGRLRSMREAGQALRSDPRATAAAAAIVPGQRAAKQAEAAPKAAAKPGAIAARIKEAQGDYRQAVEYKRGGMLGDYHNLNATRDQRAAAARQYREKMLDQPLVRDRIAIQGLRADQRDIANRPLFTQAAANRAERAPDRAAERQSSLVGGKPTVDATRRRLAAKYRGDRQDNPVQARINSANVRQSLRNRAEHRAARDAGYQETLRKWEASPSGSSNAKPTKRKAQPTPKPAPSRPPAADRAARVLAKLESRAPRARYELGTLQARAERVMSKLPAKDKQKVAGGTSGKQAVQRAKDRVAESWEGARRLDFDRTGDYPGAKRQASPSLREQAAKPGDGAARVPSRLRKGEKGEIPIRLVGRTDMAPGVRYGNLAVTRTGQGDPTAPGSPIDWTTGRAWQVMDIASGTRIGTAKTRKLAERAAAIADKHGVTAQSIADKNEKAIRAAKRIRRVLDRSMGYR